MLENNDLTEQKLVLKKKIDTSRYGRLLTGSIDMHVHFAPALQERRQTALETALTARDHGMRGLVLKNPHYPSGPLASLVSELVPEVATFGSICLEYECGGLNPYAVESAAKLGAKVVWMPVFCSKNSIGLVNGKGRLQIRGEGISLIDSKGRLLLEITEILRIIKEYNLVIATGHVSAQEIIALVEEAKQIGIDKIVVTHATSDFLSETILKPEERRMLAREGVFIEYTAWEILPQCGKVNPQETATDITNTGAEHCIMSTDCGGLERSTTAEGMREFISTMLESGLTEEEVTFMVKTNPAKLLGL